jgi:hypothetical protein
MKRLNDFFATMRICLFFASKFFRRSNQIKFKNYFYEFNYQRSCQTNS